MKGICPFVGASPVTQAHLGCVDMQASELAAGICHGHHFCFFFLYLTFNFIGVQLMYIVKLVSGFGHLMQRAPSLDKTLMLGMIEGKRRRG